MKTDLKLIYFQFICKFLSIAPAISLSIELTQKINVSLILLNNNLNVYYIHSTEKFYNMNFPLFCRKIKNWKTRHRFILVNNDEIEQKHRLRFRSCCYSLFTSLCSLISLLIYSFFSYTYHLLNFYY